MGIIMEALDEESLSEGTSIWNEVVEAGCAFPQTKVLSIDEARAFFGSQTYTGIARDDATNAVVGIYILHPNNVGRCGHICNASYAVSSSCRGRHIGERLVIDCMEHARERGFRILQFNAVVASNKAALRLYQRLGFTRLGIIPGGFRSADGTYEDIIPHYIEL